MRRVHPRYTPGVVPETLKAAAEFFDKAVAKDSGYAAAYAGLADVYAIQGYWGYVSGPELMDKGRSAARRALELDPQRPESHAALANLDFSYFWNSPEAEEESRKALALDPNSAYAHELYCWIQASKGRSQEALAECRRAVELDPLSPMNNFALADEYFLAISAPRTVLDKDDATHGEESSAWKCDGGPRRYNVQRLDGARSVQRTQLDGA
jgi:tetratricopeptide (TPR) repeat protein